MGFRIPSLIARAALLVALLVAVLVAPVGSRAANQGTGSNPFAEIPVTGTVTSLVTGAAQPFTGTVDVTQFSAQGGQLVADGVVKNASGSTIGAFSDQPVTVQQASCVILELVISVHLAVLGLVIDLEAVNLTIAGEPGTLLGDLLCAIAGGLPLDAAASQLNSAINEFQ